MIVYHVTKTQKAARAIVREMKLRASPYKLGLFKKRLYVFLYLNKPHPGKYGLHVIGQPTNEAYIFKIEIDDQTKLLEDPTGEGPSYGGTWKIAEHDVPIKKIIEIRHIKDITDWGEDPSIEEVVQQKDLMNEKKK